MTNRQKIFGVISALLLSITATEASWAADYYVSPSGNDSNSGTIDKPWKTLKKALNSVKGGETVFFRAGTYSGADAPGDLHPPAEQWITFKPYNGEKATIIGTWAFRGVSYFIIDGFEITDLNYEKPLLELAKKHGVSPTCNMLTDERCKAFAIELRTEEGWGYGLTFHTTYYGNAKTDSHHVIVRNNNIHHNTSTGIMSGVGGKAGTKGNYNFQFLNNHIHHNGYPGLGSAYGTYITGTNCIFRGNTVNDNAGVNVRIGYIEDPHHAIGWVVENNLIYNARGPFYHKSSNTVRDDAFNFALYGSEGSIVRNNIIFGSYHTGMWAVNINPAKPDLIYNNTFYGNGASGLRLSGKSIGKNNIVWGNATRLTNSHQVAMTDSNTGSFDYNLIGGSSNLLSNQGSGSESNNIRSQDNPFVNAGSGDFGLQAGSAAIDKGTALAEVKTDYTGKARPEGAAYDLGAFEGAGSKKDVLPDISAVAFLPGVIGGVGGSGGGLGNCFQY